MTKKEELLKIAGSKNVFEKGGSKAVIIPSKIVKYLDLCTGDKLLFLLDEKTGHVLVGTEEVFGGLKMGDRPATFYSPITEEELQELIKRFKKNS